jgi:ribonucleoside-diphosphate reductase alpha chain
MTTTDIYATMPANLPSPEFDPNALRVLNERYFATKPNGDKETAIEFLWRVAYAISLPEATYAVDKSPEALAATIDTVAKQFYALLQARDFMPNTPCLVNAGRPLSMLSACFVLPVPDSMDGIFESIKTMALIQKAGGGTGMAFSRLRSQGTLVSSTGKDASGPISFMKVFNAATDSIKQGGVRRGANMGVLKVDHPDVFSFMSCKKELDNENRAVYNRLSDSGRYNDSQLAQIKQELLQTQFNNFNISIGITDEFMKAVKADSDFSLRDPKTKAVVRVVRAMDIFDAIVEGAWQNGEPGVLFLDHPGANAAPDLGPIEASNPCGEIFLHPFDACNLGSINLGNFYDVANARVDWDRLAGVIHTTTRFLDNVVDANVFPVKEITDMVNGNRRLGLGIMGFADLCIKLRIAYGSPAAIALAEEIMGFVQSKAIDMSEELAKVRGDFPHKSKSIYKNDARLRRNIALTCIAPTGTISMIAGCSFGCEPYFGIAYTKHVMKDAEGRAQRLYYVLPLFEEVAKAEGFYSDELLAAVENNRGSLKGLSQVPKFWQDVFTVTSDVTVDEHIEMLAAFQKNTCNAVSKTVNAPNDDTRDSVARSIIKAYDLGCKGFTYYRDGSRTEQVVTFSKDADIATEAVVEPVAEPIVDELAAILARAAAALA